MKKLTLADKMAKKSFESKQFQESWTIHMQAFGPILKHAFVENYQARVHLTAALNTLSNRNFSQALPKLQQLQKYCETDADKTAWLFFMGLFCELTGRQDQMVQMYTYANEYGHKFYLPYMKVAKFYLEGHLYDKAEENYRAAIECFNGTGLDARDKLLLGSAYTNLASCLAMMHRLEEAEDALGTSRSLYPNAPGRAALEALLLALRGEKTQVDAVLAQLKEYDPAAWESVKESTDKIFAGTDPLFFPAALDDSKIAAFWEWFSGYSSELKQKLDGEEYEEALSPVAAMLLETFPFLEEEPYIALGKNEEGYVLELRDLYAVGIMDAYQKLLQVCPEDVKSRWQFVVVH